MSIQFYQQLAQLLEQAPVVLATVTHVKGSVPREVGAKMMIAEHTIVGTIGGGAGEAKVIREARTVLATGEKQRVNIDLSGAPQRDVQGVCGGSMQVWLERWTSETAIASVNQILTRLQAGQPATLVTPFATNQSPFVLPDAEQSATADAFVETLQPPPTLLIVGAGHVGIQLAKVANLIGFQVAVQDDRPEWANAERYPQATLIVAAAIDVALSKLADHTDLYAALVTRGYQYDLAALTALLNRTIPCSYIGMIGSEKRVRQVYQAIAQAGISKSQLRSIYAPIGLDIGALTPEEIAVSISAELILVRRGGTGRPLSSFLNKKKRLLDDKDADPAAVKKVKS